MFALAYLILCYVGRLRDGALVPTSHAPRTAHEFNQPVTQKLASTIQYNTIAYNIIPILLQYYFIEKAVRTQLNKN